MKNIRVALHDRSYDVRFGSLSQDLEGEIEKCHIRPSKLLLITTRAVEKAGHSRVTLSSLRKLGVPLCSLTIPNGEGIKNLRTIEMLHRCASRYGLDRKSVVIALGGGVLTDIGGFFAATYMRGISFVAVPTTLLGMVDAAIGGKTGVDLPEGKNLVGAFWQPRLVFVDVNVLKTLPKREWKTGMAEVIKYGVILDRRFFAWLEKMLGKFSAPWLWPKRDLLHAIQTCASLKARVVSRDERESPLAGGREIFNFGHTTGHALEAATGYNRLTHGEAVSIGMVKAAEMAVALKLLKLKDSVRLRRILVKAELPVDFPPLSIRQEKIFWQALRSDKKAVDGSLRFVLPVQLGQVKVLSGIPKTTVRAVLRYVTRIKRSS